MSGSRCANCGGLSGDSWACTKCKKRLPRELSRALFFAERGGMSKKVTNVMQTEARDDATTWWDANPPVENDAPPAWKKHAQGGLQKGT